MNAFSDRQDTAEKAHERDAQESVCHVSGKQDGRTPGQEMTGSRESHIDHDGMDEKETQCLHISGEGAERKKDQDHFPEACLTALDLRRVVFPEKLLLSHRHLQPEDRAGGKKGQIDRGEQSAETDCFGEQIDICVRKNVT